MFLTAIFSFDSIKSFLRYLLLISVDETVSTTVSELWIQSQLFFEVITPEEIAYVYKIKPAFDFGVQLVSFR